MNIFLLIPVYNPDNRLIETVKALSNFGFTRILVVNDGSNLENRKIFIELQNYNEVIILEHSNNIGKGAAIKTGIKYILDNYGGQLSIVTADADGQHLAEDIIEVAKKLDQNRQNLILGTRCFDGKVPIKSRIGNILTSVVFRTFYGLKISDTQTGLRGIPFELLPALLKIPFNRFEFETEMLLLTSANQIPIVEVSIETVYLEYNRLSKFNPLFDSMKIYFVLFRFFLSSLFSALLDIMIFTASYSVSYNIFFSTGASRLVTLLVNYFLVSKFVFYHSANARKTFPKYLALIFMSGTVSAGFIYFLSEFTSLPIIASKIVIESIIFFANFFIQERYIFNKRKFPMEEEKT